MKKVEKDTEFLSIQYPPRLVQRPSNLFATTYLIVSFMLIFSCLRITPWSYFMIFKCAPPAWRTLGEVLNPLRNIINFKGLNE